MMRVLVVLAVFLTGFLGVALAAPVNVVLIISDDQHWGDYGFMGHPHLRTPQLDRLAGEGLAFRHGYVPSSLCCPSLASIITGRYLDREGLAEDTLVLYLADNGWITDPRTGRYAPKSKQSPYDGGLRTPILVRWRGRLAPKMSEVPVSSLDLVPTILKACGIPAPTGLPGLDLADASALRACKTLYGECFAHDFKDLHHAAPNLRWRWILEDGWKLILPALPNETGGPELYCLSKDPREETNVAYANPLRVQKLSSQLDTWWPGGKP